MQVGTDVMRNNYHAEGSIPTCRMSTYWNSVVVLSCLQVSLQIQRKIANVLKIVLLSVCSGVDCYVRLVPSHP